MDVQSLALLLDQQARAEIDARLYFTQCDGKNQQTTRTVVYATDPQKNISNPFEALMTVPTDPPSSKLHLIGGHFYANGKLYAVPGMETPEIKLSAAEDTYVLVGIGINPKNDRTFLVCETYHGEFPLFNNYTIPSALVKIPAGKSPIVSHYIMDLRPFIHYNVSTPADRAIVSIACIKPQESVAFELMRGHRLPPIISFYKKLPGAGIYTITHEYNSTTDFIPLTDAEPTYDDSMNAVTLKPIITANPITIAGGPNVIVVSAMNGADSNTGTFSDPLRTLEAAFDKFNGNPGVYDTIFLQAGYYSPGRALIANSPVTIIGEDPVTCIVCVNGALPHNMFTFNDNATLRTIQMEWGVLETDNYYAIVAKGEFHCFNCIFKQINQHRVGDWIRVHSHLIISNCIMNNPYNIVPATSMSRLYSCIPGWSTAIPPYQEIVANNIVLGPWDQTFTIGGSLVNIVESAGEDPGLEDTKRYYLKPGSIGIDTGMPTIVGTDLDNTPTDVGIYGGMYASMVRHKEYPITETPVFRYAYSTMYSPVISRFVSIDVIRGIAPPECEIYGAVSFNGGHTWLIWDELLGAWKRIADLTKLPTTTSTATDLCKRLVDMGPIQTKGEIMFAWALKSSLVTNTPYFRGVNMTVKAASDTLVPIQPTDFNVVIAEDTMMVTNLSSDQIKDVVIVAY